jgi:transposase
MENSKNELIFKGAKVFIGIDVHKKNWNVTIMLYGKYMNTISMNPSPKELGKYLRRNYPQGEYYSVYEAGFCGNWIHRELINEGINNIIVKPADVPLTHKEKATKTDVVDSRRLARALSSGIINGIAIPNEQQEAFRSISRLRENYVKMKTIVKNQISELLNRYGKEIDEKHKTSRWSHSFIQAIRKIEFNEEAIKYELEFEITTLLYLRTMIAEILKKMRKIIAETETISKIICLLKTVPGIGIITGFALFTEIWDIKRFKNLDKLASYVGLSPACHNSGEREITMDLIKRKNARLRNILIEAAWIAIRMDNTLKIKYGELVSRSKPQKAIIRIAKKLLSRIRVVWINETPYINGYIGN